MTAGLVLSMFPGLDVLGMGFEAEGFSVVAGPDVVWGRDVCDFHAPEGRFDGVIGGPPCQTFSTLANLVRAKGLTPRFGNLIPEFVRVVEEAAPRWFLMENVPTVPEEDWPQPLGYAVTSFAFCNSWLDAGDGFGSEQMRKRRFWFGWPVERGPAPDLSRRVRFACLELPKAYTVVAGHDAAPGQRRKTSAVLADRRETPVRIGGSGKVKRTAPVTGRHPSYSQQTENPVKAASYTLAEMLRLQGLPDDLLEEAPFTMQGKRKLVGNAVPLPMARELARVVLEVAKG